MSVFFWNALANRYSRQSIANPEAYEAKLAATRELLTPDSAVLEFGCGTGSTALLHAPLVRSVLALDSAPKMIDIAKAKAEDADVQNITFRVGTVFDADPGPYDVVLALNVLHLVPDMPAALRQCHDLLRPGGALVASTACITGGWERWLLPIPGALGLLPRLQFFTTDKFLQAHTDAGFTMESITFPGSETSAFTIARR